LARVMNHYSPTGRRNHGRTLKRLWICDTWTGQQLAQVHDRYMMMMIMMIIHLFLTHNMY
jgi:hypothetical protein